MDDPTTERSFDSQATWVIDGLGLFFDMLSMDVCTIKALTDDRSTGVGNLCMYCILEYYRVYTNTITTALTLSWLSTYQQVRLHHQK